MFGWFSDKKSDTPVTNTPVRKLFVCETDGAIIGPNKLPIISVEPPPDEKIKEAILKSINPIILEEYNKKLAFADRYIDYNDANSITVYGWQIIKLAKSKLSIDSKYLYRVGELYHQMLQEIKDMMESSGWVVKIYPRGGDSEGSWDALFTLSR